MYKRTEKSRIKTGFARETQIENDNGWNKGAYKEVNLFPICVAFVSGKPSIQTRRERKKKT